VDALLMNVYWRQQDHAAALLMSTHVCATHTRRLRASVKVLTQHWHLRVGHARGLRVGHNHHLRNGLGVRGLRRWFGFVVRKREGAAAQQAVIDGWGNTSASASASASVSVSIYDAHNTHNKHNKHNKYTRHTRHSRHSSRGKVAVAFDVLKRRVTVGGTARTAFALAATRRRGSVCLHAFAASTRTRDKWMRALLQKLRPHFRAEGLEAGGYADIGGGSGGSGGAIHSARFPDPHLWMRIYDSFHASCRRLHVLLQRFMERGSAQRAFRCLRKYVRRRHKQQRKARLHARIEEHMDGLRARK